MVMLAEAFAEPLTKERVLIYTDGLQDIPQDRLKVSFQRALRELTWFPKVAELRSLAGMNSEDQEKVEADAAWNHVNEYLRKWGVDLLPVYSGGKKTTPPSLNARSEYALRRIGGLRKLNQVDAEKMPFMYRDFCEAYRLAPLAELMAPSLLRQFGEHKLLGNVRELVQGKAMERQTGELPSGRDRPQGKADEELTEERKLELRRMVDEELAKRKR